VDTLAKMIMHRKNKLLTGLVPGYVDNGAVILQYTDDTILCMQELISSSCCICMNPFLVLKLFFSKSEAIMISQDANKSMEYIDTFSCTIGKWSIRYLGVPVSGSRLHIADWLPLDEKMLKRLDGCQGSSLSIGGRTSLLDSN